MNNDEVEAVKELVNRRRMQILVHSCIYYRFDVNLIEDSTFDKWCNELIKLQKDYPDICKEVRYHKEFEKLTHASGFDLPYHYPQIQNRAISILNYKGFDI